MMISQRIVPLSLLFFTLSFQAGAQVPELINYQGRLVGTNGLVNGSVSLQLRIYDAPALGSILYEDSNTVTVADGLYATVIGDNTVSGTLAAALAATNAHLEVVVNGVALAPRERVLAVAYARVAAAVSPDGSGSGLDADLVDGLDSSAFATSGHDHDATYVNEGQALSVSAGMLVDGATLSEIADDDGAGSGLDADLLDGSSSAAFATSGHNHDATYVNENQTNGVTTQMITDGTLLFVDVGQNGATNGQVMKWNGSAWAAAQDNAGAGGSFWGLTGNAGLSAGTDYLGSSDSNIVEVRVDNQTVMRFEPNLEPNIVGGHASNTISKAAYGAVIAGGGHNLFPNKIHQDAHHASIAGGWGHTIGTNAQASAIGGGYNSSIGQDVDSGTIAGGRQNQIDGQADETTIGGGADNFINGPSSPHRSTIAGGARNVIRGSDSFIGGGVGNRAETGSQFSVIGGGESNLIKNLNSYDVIVGGRFNTIGGNLSAHDFSTIGGGAYNSASNDYATVPGGLSNTAVGALSFAAGNRAKALNQGTFVWGDSTGFDVSSTNNNSWTVRCIGGARFISGINGSGTATSGVQLAVGGTTFASMSDRNVKENFSPVDARDILERVAEMPVTTWNLKTQDPSIRHIGPMAQDFRAAFEVGEDEHYIPSSDADGVALAAIKGLYELVQEQRKEIDRLRQEVEGLKQEGKREPWSPSAPPEAGKLAPPGH